MILATLFEGADLASMVAGFMSLVGVLYTAWVSVKTKKDTDQINKSVNHIKPGEARLYELAVQTVMKIGELSEKIVRVEQKLDEHVASDKCPMLERCAASAEPAKS